MRERTHRYLREEQFQKEWHVQRPCGETLPLPPPPAGRAPSGRQDGPCSPAPRYDTFGRSPPTLRPVVCATDQNVQMCHVTSGLGWNGTGASVPGARAAASQAPLAGAAGRGWRPWGHGPAATGEAPAARPHLLTHRDLSPATQQRQLQCPCDHHLLKDLSPDHPAAPSPVPDPQRPR